MFRSSGVCAVLVGLVWCGSLGCGTEVDVSEPDTTAQTSSTPDMASASGMSDMSSTPDMLSTLDCQLAAKEGETCSAPRNTQEQCCPIAASDSCDCFATGGSASQPGGCIVVCDVAPISAMSVDSNGCHYWEPVAESCLGPPEDMGADM